MLEKPIEPNNRNEGNVVCSFPGCNKILGIYNLTGRCFHHRFPPDQLPPEPLNMRVPQTEKIKEGPRGRLKVPSITDKQKPQS